MPLVSIGNNIVATGTHGFVASDPDTTLIVHPGVRIAISGTIGESGIIANAPGCDIYVFGSVSGIYGVRSSQPSQGPQPDLRLTVGPEGAVSGWVNAVELADSSNVIDNAGTISAARAIGNGNGALVLTNSGLIQGSAYALDLSGLADAITNSGLISGRVQLGFGDDLFDNTGGRVIGRIDLGFGDDTLTGGDWREAVIDGAGRDDADLGGGNDLLILAADGAADEVAGGAGSDTLDLSGATGLAVVDLTLGHVRGGGFGATLISGFERVVGAENQVLRVIGDRAANVLVGGAAGDSFLAGAGNDVIRTGLGANHADGGAGNDRILGGDHGDTLIGGAGNDVIHGAHDTDLMSGGSGSDRFIFRDVEELFANTVAGDDRITDFTRGQDIIDLSDIDWNATGPDSAFTFRGTAAINGPGQVAVRHVGGNTFVDIAWQAAGAADSIRLDGIVNLTAADFWL